MKNVLVLGLGKFGSRIVQELAPRKGVRLFAFDQSEEALRRVVELVHTGASGDLNHPEVLEGFLEEQKRIDVAVISLGRASNPSILAAIQLLDRKVQHIIIKAIDPGHRRVLQAIHSSRRVEGGRFQVLIPEVDAAVRVSRRIGSDFIETEFPMADGYGIMEVNCPVSLAGKSLRELNLRQKYHITVVGHHLPADMSEPGTSMKLATPDERLPQGSLLTILGKDEDLQHFVRKFEG